MKFINCGPSITIQKALLSGEISLKTYQCHCKEAAKNNSHKVKGASNEQ